MTGGDYLNDLRRELRAVGIAGARGRRIVDELGDHLACDPSADLGAPGALARQFADELGTSLARRAALLAFGALAFAGILFGLAFASSPGPAFGAAPAGAPLLGRLGNLLAVLAPQLAFVSGVLAALRALRRRRLPVIAGAEAAVILRRAAVGLLGGMGSMIGLGLMAIEFRHHLPGSWVTFAIVVAAAGLAALLAATPALLAARRIRPVAAGARGDLFDDLGSLAPAPLRGHPWRFALATAAAVAVVIALAGVAGSDGFDGAARGIADGLVCLLGFATLGRYLGLWSPGSAGIEDR